HDAEPRAGARDALDRVAGGHLALALDGEVEARAAAREEALHHVGALEAGGELVAGKPRLGGDQLGRADPEAVADLNVVLEQALAGEVLPERAVLERDAGQLRAPVRVVLGGIGVDGLLPPAVRGQVGLPVAVQVERAHGDAARHRLLEDAGGDRPALPGDLPRQADVHRDDPHRVSPIPIGCRPAPAVTAATNRPLRASKARDRRDAMTMFLDVLGLVALAHVLTRGLAARIAYELR